MNTRGGLEGERPDDEPDRLTPVGRFRGELGSNPSPRIMKRTSRPFPRYCELPLEPQYVARDERVPPLTAVVVRVATARAIRATWAVWVGKEVILN